MSGHILERQIDGLSCAVTYYDDLPRSKEIAEKMLQRQVDRYKEHVRINELDVHEYAKELKSKFDNTCRICGSENYIYKTDRVVTFGNFLSIKSAPSPYQQCTNCGNQHEIINSDINMFIAQAEHRINKAKEGLLAKR